MNDELFNVNPEEIINFTQIDKTYSFFKGAISFIAGVCSINLLIDSYKNQAIPYTDGHFLYFEGRKNVTNKIYYIFPIEIYKYLLENKWPDVLTIHHKEKTFEDSDEDIESINSFEKVFLSLGQATFTQFWEDIKVKIHSKYGSNQENWKNIFQFGWIIRNALAHNFRVSINNKKIDNITWNGLNFGYSTNGIDISEQIMFFELIILMKDIEDELNI